MSEYCQGCEEVTDHMVVACERCGLSLGPECTVEVVFCELCAEAVKWRQVIIYALEYMDGRSFAAKALKAAL